MAKKPTVAELTDPAFTPEPVKPALEKESEGTAYTPDEDPVPAPQGVEDVSKWREEGERIAKAFDRKHLARQFAATIFSFKGFTVNEKTLPEQAYKYADAFLAYEAEIGA